MLRTISIASTLVLLAAASASAQQEPPPPADYGQQPPAAQQQPGESNAYNQNGEIRVVEQGSPEAQAMTAEQGRGVEAGGHLVVPFYVNRPDLQPGIGVQGRFGWEFPHGITVELNIGVQANRFDSDIYDDYLTAIWIGGGVRYSFLNPSAIVPFVGLNLQASLWSQCLETSAGSGVCSGDYTTAGFGLMPLAGIAWELSPQVALELGVQVTISFFDDQSKLVRLGGADPTSVYISPFLGGTFYF